MDHLAYYNEGCESDPSESGLMVWTRRQFRRVLMPASSRLVQILGSLCDRLDDAETLLGKLRSQLGALRNQLGTLRSQLGAVQIRLDDHQIRLDDHQTRFDDHQHQLAQIPSQFARSDGRLGDLDGQLDAVAGRLDEQGGQLGDQQGVIAALTAQLADLRQRQEEQAARFPATVAFGWDYVALTRRLGVLEEHVDALLAPPSSAATGTNTHPAIAG